MKHGRATGLQIAFLMFAVMLLAVPITSRIVSLGELSGAGRVLVEKGMHFFLACLLIAAVAPLRRFVGATLRPPIPGSMRGEVALVGLANLAIAFALPAALALWFWVTQGPERVERMIVNVDREATGAFSAPGLVMLVLSVFLGPVIEEIVFRGFIYRAFERQWGWFASLLATSALFGAYHPHFWSAFAGSVLLICLLRRTGTLRAPILVHMFFNLMLWWPLLGQHVFPHGVVLTDPASWLFHGACLAFVAVALPIYVWMARERQAAPTLLLQPDGALQK